MGKFACIVHPLDINLVRIAFNAVDLKDKPFLVTLMTNLLRFYRPSYDSLEASSLTSGLMQKLIKKIFEWIPSFKCSEITVIGSKSDKEVIGYFVYCALLPEQIISLNQKFVLRKLIDGGKIAQSLGCNIFGLGAYASQPGNKGVKVAKALNIPVTSGIHYTIATAIEAVIEVAKKVGIKLEQAKIGIIGATGSIGRICSQVLAETAGELTLVARNKTRLETLADNLRKNSKAKISTSDNLLESIKNSDITIMSTSTPKPLLDIEDLASGTIVYDISRPRNVSMNKGVSREDVLVIDGGVIKPPGEVKFNFYFGLPEGLCYACMAETMILALEERYESYSIGGNVSLQKVKEIADLGRKHGFRLAKLRSFDHIVSESVMEKVKESYNKRKGIG